VEFRQDPDPIFSCIPIYFPSFSSSINIHRKSENGKKSDLDPD